MVLAPEPYIEGYRAEGEGSSPFTLLLKSEIKFL
jgi:hypothetical protein